MPHRFSTDLGEGPQYIGVLWARRKHGSEQIGFMCTKSCCRCCKPQRKETPCQSKKNIKRKFSE